MRHLMTRIGLTVNEAKTRLARLPEENFDFLAPDKRGFGQPSTAERKQNSLITRRQEKLPSPCTKKIRPQC
jgi:hypothetical protein